jgi:hypothetical protein
MRVELDGAAAPEEEVVESVSQDLPLARSHAPIWNAARRCAAAMIAVGVAAACQKADAPPGGARVNPLPAGVQGLGPAVFLTAVTDAKRTDLIGLRAVAKFGDEVAGAAPIRRHVEVALGDPTIPTVAEGKGDEGRDAVLIGGRVVDTTLPDHTRLQAAVRAAPGLSLLTGSCLTVRSDGRIAGPGAQASGEQTSCYPAELGGIYWQMGNAHRYGGIDLSTGAATGALDLPARPNAVSPDGKYLVAVTPGPKAELVIADLSAGTSTTGRVDLPGMDATGVLSGGAFATVLQVGDHRDLSTIGRDGAVNARMTPVGQVAFSPDGRYALVVVDEHGAQPRLAVVDLPGGARRDVDGALVVGGSVTAVIAGHHALVLSLCAPASSDTAESARARGRVVDLVAARSRPVAVPEQARQAQIEKPGDSRARDVPLLSQTFAPLEMADLATAQLFPGGELMTIAADGTVAVAPPNALPHAALPGGRILYRLMVGQKRRHDMLLVIDRAGKRSEIRTGVAEGQRLGELVPTPDGEHLLVALHPDTPRFPDPGPKNEIVLVRLDGAGDPLVLYRDAILASLGVESAAR